jgi:hypothetical protein
MGAMADRIDAIHVHASAPAGGVHAELRGRDGLDVYFSSGFYRQTDERELEFRLTGVARLLWAEHERAYRQAVANFVLYPGDPPAESVADVQFYEERDSLLATGRSDDERISVSVRGMRDWQVRIAPGTVRTLDEATFLAGARQAAIRLLSDQARQMIQLKVRVYG